MLKKYVILVLSVFVFACFIHGAASAKVKETAVSQQKATSLCKGHGGGTDCSWCHKGHCHQVGCNGDVCDHVVVSNIHGKPGNIRVPVSGVKGEKAGTPPKAGPRRPVHVGGGVKPVISNDNKGGDTNHIGRRH
jgi:hypothetical protein